VKYQWNGCVRGISKAPMSGLPWLLSRQTALAPSISALFIIPLVGENKAPWKRVSWGFILSAEAITQCDGRRGFPSATTQKEQVPFPQFSCALSVERLVAGGAQACHALGGGDAQSWACQ
jgi:hypothetical protein